MKLQRICNKKRILCMSLISLLSISYAYLNIRNYLFNEKKMIQLLYSKTASLRLYNQSKRQTRLKNLTCSPPSVPLWSPEVESYFEPVDQIVCDKETNWVYTKDSKFFISSVAQAQHGKIRCNYYPIINNRDGFEVLKRHEHFKNGSQLLSDTFKVTCTGADGKTYENIHPCIAKLSNVNTSNDANKFNVFILGFDSLSRQMVQRMLPKTYAYFIEQLDGLVLNMYNILGDGTTAALLPIFAGKKETEVEEIRRGEPDVEYLDEVMTFIWKRFENHGYITQYGEDAANINTFNFKYLGFKETPVHHYMRTFQLVAQPTFSKSKRLCLGSKPRHKIMLDWLKEGLAYQNGSSFFTFGFFNELSHDNNNPVRLCDDDNVEFMRYMKTEGFLENTIFILMSDHGSRHGLIRPTEQGKIEERMPFFGFSLPASFKSRFPEKFRAVAVNTERLVTPFDIHETLLDVLNETDTTVLNNTNKRGISIFKEIPENRTCFDAGIEPHWCTCMQWDEVSVSNSAVIAAVDNVLLKMNYMLRNFSLVCHTLKVRSIHKAIVYRNNPEVLKYKGSPDGRIADLSDKLRESEQLYQVTFETFPGLGLFEATVKLDIKTSQYIVQENGISRLNLYGNISQCVSYKDPRLRPYCVCK